MMNAQRNLSNKRTNGAWQRLALAKCLRFPAFGRLVGLSLACVLLTSGVNGAPPRPNVVMLLSDDLGWQDIGCYGGPVETPTLDALAASGVRFTDFHSGAAVCSPSRAVLLTGRTNLRCGIYSWINDYDQQTHLPRSEVTLAEILKQQGYATAHFGKWHLGMPTNKFPKKPTPTAHGFDHYCATANNAQPSHRNPRNFVRDGKPLGKRQGYACDLVVDDAIKWLESSDLGEKPFFLNVWFHEPHAPLAAPDRLVRKYGESNDPAAVYSATVANTDQAIARLLGKISEHEPSTGDTLIIYASDNGSYRADRVGPLRGTKGSNYEGGIRVPGIFVWKNRIPAKVSAEPAGLVDVVPTVCGLLGIEPPKVTLDGADLSPVLLGTGSLERKQPLFFGLPLAGPAIAIRDGKYSMLAYRKGAVPRDLDAIAKIKSEIKATLKAKGIFESETRGGSFDKQLFEGFADRDAERLRGKFIRLNQFHESWIPELKESQFTRFELYDLESDLKQSENLELRRPILHAQMKEELLRIASEVLNQAVDWTLPESERSKRVHRLESNYRSPFDAFLYVNRIPSKLEIDETPEDLTGRILGRLANQEGRVLVKLPPGMNRQAYAGFKVALDCITRDGSELASCFLCHELPNMRHRRGQSPVPTLRNCDLTFDRLKKVLTTGPHANIDLRPQDLGDLHAFVKTLTDGPDNEFRDLILKATVLDTSGELE